MTTASWLKRAAFGGAAFFFCHWAAAGILTITNSFTVTTSHTFNVPVGVGANTSYTDNASASIPLFDPDTGILLAVGVTAQSVNPSFQGDISVVLNLLGLTTTYTQTQQLSFTFSNVTASASGPIAGPTNGSGHLASGVTLLLIATNPATLNSSFVFTNAPDLAAFTGVGGPGPAGNFTAGGSLASTYQLGNVSLLTSMDGAGSYPLQVTVTYLYDLHGPPNLALGFSGGKLAVTWPSFASGFQLESTPSVLSPQWTPVTNLSGFTNGAYTVVVDTNAAQTFYRLKVP